MAEPLAFEDLERCPVCGAHVIGNYEPVNITVIGGPERWVAGSHHICPGSTRRDRQDA